LTVVGSPCRSTTSGDVGSCWLVLVCVSRCELTRPDKCRPSILAVVPRAVTDGRHVTGPCVGQSGHTSRHRRPTFVEWCWLVSADIVGCQKRHPTRADNDGRQMSVASVGSCVSGLNSHAPSRKSISDRPAPAASHERDQISWHRRRRCWRATNGGADRIKTKKRPSIMVAADPRPSAGGFTACLSGLRQVKDDRRTAEDFAASNWCNRATEARSRGDNGQV